MTDPDVPLHSDEEDHPDLLVGEEVDYDLSYDDEEEEN